ncbi:hypothetical protein QBC37DRAFT_381389 [Rhypophila decipiens]|uniref:Uncharacterized protein n=1 Tax=Rhypophila decipiens TaxID=261697 RepID=A0AAN6XV50_9PEZI|nr:hypothetical protein QBC37DRAFT_381389 [Rhypophila decipiens]
MTGDNTLVQDIITDDWNLPPIDDLVGLVLRQHLFHTFEDMVAHNPLIWPGLRRVRNRPLLLDALLPAIESLNGEAWRPRVEMVDTVDLLLQTCDEPKDSVAIINASTGEGDEMCLWNIYAYTVSHAVETFLRIFKLFLKYHTDYKSTTANLASMRSRLVAFLKSPQTQADARLSRFNQEVGEAIGLIDELELSWARQRQAQADSESMVTWRVERDILAANPEEETKPGTDLVEEDNTEGNCIDSGAKHRTPDGSSRADRFKRWFHQRRLRVSARPKSDSKPHI